MSTNTAETPELARCRRFTLGDGMLFVAATAVAMAIIKSTGIQSFLRDFVRSVPFGALTGFSDWWTYLTKTRRDAGMLFMVIGMNLGVTFLMPMTVAYVIARLRRPRPPLRRLRSQPGMVAFESVVVTFVLTAVVEMTQPPLPSALLAVPCLMPLPLSWVVLALSGRWRREPGWIDRFGVGLGAGWCMVIVVFVARACLYP